MTKKQLSFSVLITLFICISFFSCSEEYSSPLKGKTLNNVEMESDNSSTTLSLGGANLSKINAISSESWCFVSIDATSIYVRVNENTTYDDRKATVTLTDNEDGSTLSFNVTQKQKNAIKLSENTSYEFPEEGGTYPINVSTNVEILVEIPSDCNWLKTTSGTRGLSDTKVYLTASKNNSGEKRETTINLKDPKGSVSTPIKIRQTLNPFIEVEKTNYILTDEEEIEVRFKTNSKFTIDVYDSWIYNNGYTEVSENNYVLKLHIYKNPSNNERSSTVYIASTTKKDNKMVDAVIKIVQKAAFSIKPTYIELFEGETYNIQVTSNNGSSLTWSSSNTNVATVDSKGQIKAVGEGTAIITVKTTDGKYSAQCDVKVTNILSKLSYGWTTSYISIGGYTWYSVGCELKNNSTKDIYLTKCTFYQSGIVLASTTDISLLGVLEGGQTKALSVKNVSSLSGLKCVWEFTFNGKSYSYTCE